MPKGLKRILTYLTQHYGFDFPETRYDFFSEKILDRAKNLDLEGFGDYLNHLEKNPEEMNRLLDILTINVSRFFRNPMIFEYLEQFILPAPFFKKSPGEIRIWSAGCAMGEEAYSLAILAREAMAKRDTTARLRIFATDINPRILKNASRGVFRRDQIDNVKYGLMDRYFDIRGDEYHLAGEITGMVNFSFYDMMDRRTYVPPESVFGNFDLVLCRNLLIYFSRENRKKIFDKLYRSLAPEGCLVLGSAEDLPATYAGRLVKENDCCRIFRKSGTCGIAKN